MLFNSLSFAFFLPIVFILYWAIPHKMRWLLLLAASYYFYMSWNIKYIILILFTTVVSYIAARLLENDYNIIHRKIVLSITLVSCIGILFFFKYFNFFSESLSNILGHFSIQLHPVTLKILLPVGISFYTFQTLSYVIDVYKGKVKPEHHFGIYAAFISFFPQLVAGPIERTDNLLPQIKEVHYFDNEQAMQGVKLMVWGYFKKMVIADAVAPYVDLVFENPSTYYGFDYMIAIFFFTMQIYCDFSGYSDIAIGTAKLFGINLMTNFKSPYFSASIKEFWSRWHISLSSWFRDYVYIPLGGNRCSKVRHAANLLITFLASGLWHGANWTFVVWGGIHGLAQIVENLLKNYLGIFRKNKLGKWIATLIVFAFCNIAWVFFRANTLGESCYIIQHLFEGIDCPLNYFRNNLGISVLNFIGMGMMILILALYDYIDARENAIQKLSEKNFAVRWSVYIIIGLIVVFLSQKGEVAEFVYFQF